MTRLPVQVPGLPTVAADGREVRSFVTSKETKEQIARQAIKHAEKAVAPPGLEWWLASGSTRD